MRVLPSHFSRALSGGMSSMTDTSSKWLPWLLWLVVLLLFVGVWMYPESNGKTRAAGVGLFFVVWVGLISLVWRRRAVRNALLGLTILAGLFLALPARE